MKSLIIAVFITLTAFATPSDKLLDAISVVESHNDDHAVNVKEAAVGRYQIRPQYLKEVNRIQRMRKGTAFTYADRLDKTKARQMVKIYLCFWGEQYRKATGKAPTDEVYAKIHNGHSFWKKGDAAYHRKINYYWNKVVKAMQ